MAIKKSDRIAVHKKYGGRCAYCGKLIDIKGMQVDHVLPGFRALMRGLRKRVEDIYIVKVAIDYKIITIKDFDGKFYFEKE